MRWNRARRRWRYAFAALLSVVLVGAGVVPAQAAPGDPEYLRVTKTVAPETLSQGEPFTYTIVVNCSEASCLDAQLVDALPAELDGYAVRNVTMSPAASVIPRDVTWTVDGASSTDAPAVITADTALQVDFTAPVAVPAGTGLGVGQTFTVTLTLQVPDNVPPGEQTIVNTATTTATNSHPAEDTATVTVVVPEVIDVDVTKAWSPSPQSFNPGNASTIALGVTNTSNGPVETLIIQEPAQAAPGASTLDASNPFTITDFTGFSGASLPDGATAVQVDAYVQQADGTWAWQTGVPSTSPELPADVTPAEVGGIRLTYTGDAIAQDAVGTVSLGLAQRATNRNDDGDLSTESHTVTNVVEGTAAVDGRDPVTDTATAAYTVNPATVAVAATKDISPARIAAGDSSTATASATNTSDVGVNELRFSDLDYFTEDVLFGGFSAAPTWPADAESAVVIYHPLAGGDPVQVAFSDGDIPAPPADEISGFEIVFSATNGAIAPASSTLVTFGIDTVEGATGAAATLATQNTIDASVRAPNGLTATHSDDAALTLVRPAIDVTLAKTVLPSTAVAPGEPVVTELEANLTTTSSYVTAIKIVVEDSWGGPETFWDAFNLTSVAPSQVPADTALTIEVRDANGNWSEIAVFPAQSGPYLVALTTEEIAAALPSGTSISDVTGIRFTFDNESATGFPSDTTVTPYFTSTARSDLRSGNTFPPVGTETTFTNTATVEGEGETEIGTPVTDDDEQTGEAVVKPTDGRGPVGIDKRWNLSTVPAQSQQQRTTTLDWRVNPGFATVVLSDPTNPQSPQDSVFEAFDLVSISPIAASSTPFTNGWYLRYDVISGVELYNSATNAWEQVTAPAAGWIQNGRFVGYTLTTAERASTTGARVTLAENSAARDAAAQMGPAFDPFAPDSGTGVASSSAPRSLALTWQVRDQMRPSAAWVTDTALYNTSDAGVVDNTARLDATPIAGGPAATAGANAIIRLTNLPPGVTVTKAASPATPLYVPVEGTAAERFPSATFTMSAQSNSVAKASYVRVMDPPACTDSESITLCQSDGTVAGALADPFTEGVDWLTNAGQGSPFDRFDLTGVSIAASIPAQVDLGASTAWLLRYSGGTYTTEATTAAAVNAMTAADLADVVGVSVTFQGSDPAITGGTITAANVLTVTMQTKLRTHYRSSGEPQTIEANRRVDVPNRVFAQSYDPILNDGVLTGAETDATVVLTGGDLNVGPVKTVAPTALTEPTRDTPVTVTLGANQGTAPVSTLAPAEVRLTDDTTLSPEFWDQFDFAGLGTLTAPAGADQVRVGAFGDFDGAGPAWVWSADAPIADAVFPVASDLYGDVEGVQFVFSRADGQFFSPVVPAPVWNAAAAFTVQLRDTYRESGERVVLSGDVENTVTVISDRLNGETSEIKSTSAVVGLSPGTFEIEVNKTANNGNHFATPGASIPWDLTFTNAGTGYLTISELRDTLPASLLYLGVEPEYTPDPAGMLPVPEGMTVDGSDLVFTWPADARRMAPGETFGIRIMLELQPGLTTGQRAVNEMTVHTNENLVLCSNSSGGSVTDAWATDDTTCGTTDYVSPSAGPNLFTVKGVRGSVDGAINPNAPAQVCAQNLTATGGTYFRAPCAANSVIGGVDDWVLRVQNAGTTMVNELTIFDQLPTAGDQSLISGASRGSVYRPQMLDGIEVAAPAGVTSLIQVTTSAGVCVGTWGNLQNQEPCEQNGEVWVTADDDTDWASVTGLRVQFDFTRAATGTLRPGEFVDVTFSTVNVPASPENATGAPVAVPATDSFAWNQFGVKYRDEGATTFGKIAPANVGVHLLFGSIQIEKTVTGPAGGYAPTTFLVDVDCTIEGVAIDMGANATVELTDANDYTHRIDGIPLGASCTITEQGDVGAFGETSREGTPVTITVAEATPDAVPAAQIAQLSNDYQFSGLSVTKRVDTEAVEGSFGPFEYTLVCTTATGLPVVFEDGMLELTFTLVDGETFTAPADTIPARSECTVTETDAADANGVVIVGTGVTDNGDGSAQVEVGVLPAEVEFVNSYDSGVLRVVKQVAGEGAALYGAGPFTFTAVCEHRGATILDVEFVLEADSERTFGPFPTGTECVVQERGTGGATSTVLEPSDGTVVVTDAVDALAEVIATNTFDVTAIEVTKVVSGETSAPGAAGPFVIELECTWLVDGVAQPIVIPGGAVRTLVGPDALSATYGPLPVDASCVLTETETQSADSTTIEVSMGGAETVVSEGTSATIDLAGTTEPVTVRVTNVFAAALPATGSSIGWLAGVAAGAGALLLLGALLIVSRRRQTSGG